MKLIETHEQLDLWLYENAYFEDGGIIKIETNPFAITIGYLLEGNYCAYTKKIMRTFQLLPRSVTRWDDCGEKDFIEGIEALKVDNGIALQFIAPPKYLLIADSIAIRDAQIFETTFKPWLNRKKIFFTAALDHIPTPHFWVETLKTLGYDIVFRYFSGEAKSIEQVPYPNYMGHFFQLASNIKSSKEGIFIDCLSLKDGTITMSFENRDDRLEKTWIDLNRILADMPNAHISCGNCQFSGEEWKKQL